MRPPSILSLDFHLRRNFGFLTWLISPKHPCLPHQSGYNPGLRSIYMGREESLYTPEYYRDLASVAESAREILPIVLELLHPKSIVDVGCGVGYWPAVAMECGVGDVLGVDGDWVLNAQLAIPREKFMAHDLTKPLVLNRRFDLAISIEVAEHLPATQAERFVKSLGDASDLVLFSAAIPKQGGRRHLNEQWPEYWADHFQRLGYECYDVLRTRIWNNPRVMWYYAQNCLIFAKRGAGLHLGTPCLPLPLVHPNLWLLKNSRFESPWKLLEMLPKAVSRLVWRKVQRH